MVKSRDLGARVAGIRTLALVFSSSVTVGQVLKLSTSQVPDL